MDGLETNYERKKMEEEKKLKAIAIVIISAIFSVSGCVAVNVSNRTKAAVEMQKNGADPLDIPCAIGDGTERYCELRAASKAAASIK